MQPSTMAECLEPDAAPVVPGFIAQEVLREGTLGVAIGERTGSERHLATAVGFDVRSRRVLWQRVLPHENPKVAREGSPRIADLRNGKLFVLYDAWQARWKLAALDAATGAPLWEKDLPAPAFFTASATELFVPVGAEGIRIFDLRTGLERAFPAPAAAPQMMTPR
jgi:outer membrane protein assembly factor BamB